MLRVSLRLSIRKPHKSCPIETGSNTLRSLSIFYIHEFWHKSWLAGRPSCLQIHGLTYESCTFRIPRRFNYYDNHVYNYTLYF